MPWNQVVLVSWIALFVISIALVERAESSQSRLLVPAVLFVGGTTFALLGVAMGWPALEKIGAFL